MNKEDIQKLMEAYQSVVSEKSVSQQQQKLMGLALAYKRGEVSADKISPEAKAMADKMSEKDLEDFAKTKHKGLPVTKEEAEQVDEGPDYLGDIRRKKERDEKKKASQHDGETQRQKMMRKVYGKAMGGLKKEEVELDEISGKLARKAAARSTALANRYADDWGPWAGDDAEYHSKKADKSRAHVQKRQGEKGVKKVDRLANKLVYGRSRAFESADLEEASDKYMVKYTGPDKSGRTSGPFSKAAAEKKAAMGNKADKVGGKYEVLRYVESVEESLNEELWKEIEAYAKKHGGIDKKDMMKVAMMLKKGDRKGAVKYARGLDTDPRDWLLDKMDESFEQDLESLDEKSCGKDRMKKESDDEDKKMDPVNKKALKKDFDDRDDKDIDNDGDVDGSDEYLHNRRKAVGKAMSKDDKKIRKMVRLPRSLRLVKHSKNSGLLSPKQQTRRKAPLLRKKWIAKILRRQKSLRSSTRLMLRTRKRLTRPQPTLAEQPNLLQHVLVITRQATRISSILSRVQ
jgi:hypothetical protein